MQSQSSYQALKKEIGNKANLTPGVFSFLSSSSNHYHVKTPPKNNWQKKPDILQRDMIQNVKMGNHITNTTQSSRQNTQSNNNHEQNGVFQEKLPQQRFDNDQESAQLHQNADILRQSLQNLNNHHQKSLDGLYLNNYHQNKFFSGSSKERPNSSKDQTPLTKSPNSIGKMNSAAVNQNSIGNRVGRENGYSKMNSQTQLDKLNTNQKQQNTYNRKEVQSSNKRQQRSSSIYNEKNMSQNQQQQQQQQNRLIRSNSSNINQNSNNKDQQHPNSNQKYSNSNKEYIQQMKSTLLLQQDNQLINEDSTVYNNKLHVDIIENILNKEEQYLNWRNENIQLKDTVKNLINEMNEYKKKCTGLEQENIQLEQNLNQSKNNYQMELIKFSDQIWKFKKIQSMYQSEKQISERMEKELILKDQELSDTKQHLKNTLLFLLEQKDNLCLNDEENQGQNTSFSFEERMEGMNIANKYVLKSIEKFINKMSPIINELKITYICKEPKSYLNMPKQVNHFDKVSQKQESQMIKNKENDNIQGQKVSTQAIKKVESKKIFTKNNPYQIQMQKQILDLSNASQQNNNQSQISTDHHEQSIQNRQFLTQNTEQDHEDQVYIPSLSRFNAVVNKQEIDCNKKIQQQRSLSCSQSRSYIQQPSDSENKFLARPLASVKKTNDNQDNQDKNSNVVEINMNLMTTEGEEGDNQDEYLLNKITDKTFEFNETFQKINDGNNLNNETLTFDLENNPANSSREEKSNDKQNVQQKQENKQEIYPQKKRNGNRNSSLGSVEYSQFKQNLEDYINNNDSLFQNTAFNSQQLEHSAANPIRNKSNHHQQQSITDFEIAVDTEKVGLFDNNKDESSNKQSNKKVPIDENNASNKQQLKSLNSSVSDSEQENRCQSLSTKVFKDKTNIINNQKQQSTIKKETANNPIEDKKFLKPPQSQQNAQIYNKKPPIDTKDKENKCPNNFINNSEQQIKENKPKLGSKIETASSESKAQKQGDENKIVISKFEYAGQKDGHLSFKEGEKIQVLKQTKNGWWIGMCNNKIGYFPFNFVEEIKSA